MKKYNLGILLGIILLLLPFAGLPSAIKNSILIGLGIVILIAVVVKKSRDRQDLDEDESAFIDSNDVEETIEESFEEDIVDDDIDEKI